MGRIVRIVPMIGNGGEERLAGIEGSSVEYLYSLIRFV